MKYLFLLLLLPSIGFAASTVEITPAKIELKLAANQATTTNISIINHSDLAIVVNVGLQDFSGSDNPEVPAKLLGTTTSPYSLSQFVTVPRGDRQFLLQPKERRTVPVQISLPPGMPGGARYTSLVFEIDSPEHNDLHFKTAIASLIFVTIDGPTKAAGELKDFSVRSKGTMLNGYDMLFENSGDIYLNPYGYVSLRDWRGRETNFTELRPAFVMPDSARLQKIPLTISLVPGWYRAELVLNRGYNNQIDRQTVNIFIWPKWLGLGSGLAVILAWLLIWWRRSKGRQ